MVFSIVQSTELEGALRLDADYYEPRFLNLKKVLESIKTTKLSEISTISTGPAYASESMGPDFEIPLARIGDVTRKTDINSWIRLSAEEFRKYKSKRVLDNEILMTMTGDPPDVGKCNIVKTEGMNLAFNQRVAKLTSRKHLVLFAYLSTEYARAQSERNSLGIRQRNVGIGDIRNIQIPVFSAVVAKEIEKSVSRYLLFRKNSKLFMAQAEGLFLGELGIKNSDLTDELTFETSIDEIEKARRFDAEYFRPKYEELLSNINTKKFKRLLDVVENVETDFKPANWPKKKFNYVELANINSAVGIIDGANIVLGVEAPGRAKRLLKENDVIVSSIEGSLEKIALVGQDQNGFIASNGFFQFRSKAILAEVLLVLFKSIVMQSQLKQNCAGTILTAIPNEGLKNMSIPILPKPAQQKIAKLVKESHLARKKSKEMLEKAKKTVEDYIERG